MEGDHFLHRKSIQHKISGVSDSLSTSNEISCQNINTEQKQLGA